jgi:hypothetical protein
VAKVIEVIYTEELRGNGTDKNPFRRVPQLFTVDGKLICEAEYTFNEPMDGSGHFEGRCFHDVLKGLDWTTP